MTDDGDGPDSVDERVLAFLRTADRPRHLASDVAAALDLPRGRVRTRLGSLAAAGRVVRTDTERTARWAVPDRADEPEPTAGPDPGSLGVDGDERGADVAGEPDGDVDGPTDGAVGGDDRSAHGDTSGPASADGPDDGETGAATSTVASGAAGVPDAPDARWLADRGRALGLLVALLLAFAAIRRVRRG